MALAGRVLVGGLAIALLAPSSAEGEDVPVRSVLILGKTGNGKSTTGNVFAGEEMFKAADEMVSVTQVSDKKTWARFGTRYVFVDTPGIFDTERCHEDIFREITNVIYLSPEGFHAIAFQLDPTSRFTAEEQNTVDGLVAVSGGKEVLRHVFLVFSHGDKWPVERIMTAAAEKKLPKGLLSLLTEVGSRVVSIDTSSEPRKEQSAKAMHDMISHVMDFHGNKTYSNAHFEDARSRLESIAQHFDPEARLRAQEEALRRQEEEVQRRVKEAEEAAKQRSAEEAKRLRTEMELEYARRELQAQQDRYEERLRHQQQLEQEREEWRQRELALARHETQQIVYMDTTSGYSGGSWCSVL